MWLRPLMQPFLFFSASPQLRAGGAASRLRSRFCLASAANPPARRFAGAPPRTSPKRRSDFAFENIGLYIVRASTEHPIIQAKNLVLAGVKSVTLHDEGVVELWDLSGNFFFTEEDVGKNRALACVQKLQELNNAVLISSLTTQLSKEKLSDFQAVVFTDISLDKAIEFDNYCHNHQPPISFIKCEVRGLFGSVFCDFGPEFTVLDVDGEDQHTGIVASISNDNPAMISCVDDERLEFQDGDFVLFTEVHGMTELNDGKPIQGR